MFQFGMFETVTGTIMDLFPRLTCKYKLFQYGVLIGTALVLFLLSIPLAMSVRKMFNCCVGTRGHALHSLCGATGGCNNAIQ